MATTSDSALALCALYDDALPRVYGYLVARVNSAAIAEDLTSEVFMAAVNAVNNETVNDIDVAWLIGVARHKLIDHWRAVERHERKHQLLDDDEEVDQWDVTLDALLAHQVLSQLGAHHRGALTLRYLDELSVPEVAEVLDRTVHATEALLVRARIAFRRAYEKGGAHAD